MKVKFAVVALALSGLLFACNKDGYKKSDSGLLYKIYTDNKGEKIKEGDFVKVNLIYKTDSDSVLLNTYKMGRPYELIIQKSMFKGDMMDAFKMLCKDDSASFKILADSIFSPKFGMQKMPPFIKAGSYLTFVIKIVDVKTKVAMDAEATKAVDKFVTDSKLAFNKTASGLRYLVTTPAAAGTPVKLGDTVKVHYTGKLLDGTKFDSSEGRAPFELPVQKGVVIDGWVEALQLLKKGEKATVVIPAKLAYGEMGNGPIPPNSPLVFDLEIVDVKPATAAPVSAAK
ncbi:FKBP-type peptidyl-prolyl cis-trans isomerase [Solitalea sp. MAHUQ-68]|uniref:Peptidyl-prolyl cis-trans isomerase n=1 Tax=Solitalea agri TaxID=2953739 RepID=A0A9X2EZY9_9SPHI|nr:FKBP-type peptidyl-prolyl cis-trans isomerase [Solitalea agri]MCO4292062.1 FKBP-type peptidyl-prolyl cis-trans isomerase [Solitalea agri]